ncbi:uncharacterized protein L3040_007020 [Drepanopeziza brunnea f. sp. 'multigermtubi']|uniref:Uncharacterized protein n=1 Tax=Marssonina brunnea f. sp. multigermtubi (strain MB_m1) TaxID=1072389 RepID=K1W738_MARBU|nr:uncharacterized protein MBM_09094 [Drepanopeziza brunnea f. sp. 'multigermtubi' MB_m1]EKD12865.1 hypothetical protein MBM_09094 [Drepanopeziza brunnea f. sp. 'multigermtubi' MB_m1]KAJ5038151.1 hypothetical protein L3040_007020 [Drepanopeziza brunnea f. sp. 'multigermtubi']
MPPTTSNLISIPRFLLPQRGAIWRTRLSTPPSTPLSVRHASKVPQKKPVKPSAIKDAGKPSTSPKPSAVNAVKDSSKPLVLEKPAKFNPPSHGARLRREAPRYPGPRLSEEQAAAQKKKKYPNMMPPEGSFMNWFLNNRSIHLYISLGTLFGLAATVWITNFKRNSPFADMLPAWSQLFLHPIAFFRTFGEVIKMNSDYVTAETMERRKRKVEDVAKRAAYRKAHGMENDEAFGGWTAKSDEQLLGPAMPVGDAEPVRATRPVKKWLGIW